MYDKYYLPPPREVVDFEFARPFIKAEAERQLLLFYSHEKEVPFTTLLKVYVDGITNALAHGTAVIERNGTILWWHPGKGEFCLYDEELNEFLMGAMRAWKFAHAEDPKK